MLFRSKLDAFVVVPFYVFMKLFNKMLDRMKFLQIEKLCFQQAEEILGNRWPCEKFSVNSPTVIKNDVVERLEKQPLLFYSIQ